jgi:hypothetical protein
VAVVELTRRERVRADRRLAAAGAWLLRYGPAEVCGTLGAVLGAQVAVGLGHPGYAAVGAFLAEAVVFYGVVIGRDLRYARRHAGPSPRVVLRRVLTEFGPAEAADWVVRPLLMHMAMLATTPAAGAVLGKVAADVVFWIIATVGYRRSRLTPYWTVLGVSHPPRNCPDAASDHGRETVAAGPGFSHR